ncbi:MAG: ATP synthase d subunit [Alyxoria varia]|nr:MAG: ATP synthase d subunit [Alyxoria varia]
MAAAPQRTASASTKIDWTRLTSSLGLKGNTATALTAFKKRNDDARRRLQTLQERPTTVDFKSYRDVLKNTAVIDEVERSMRDYKVKTVDVSRQLKSIEGFEAQAVASAQETASLVSSEMKALEQTMKNIEEARPFEECTTEEIFHAEPAVAEKTEHHVKNHRWMPPGYKEKFGDLSVM